MISIVMTYYNRRTHLTNTLKSISYSEYKDIEVIVVDDCSNDENRIEDLVDIYKFLYVIRIDPDKKKHVNPCIPYNMGLSKAIGDIIILQNAECYHYNDVLKYTSENIKQNQYLAFTVINMNLSEYLSSVDLNKVNSDVVIDINNVLGYNWYCHEKYRPKAYHFCTAIYRKDMKTLNGFDERFGNGIDYDDDELLARIGFMNMEIKFVNEIIVIHQSHPSFLYNINNVGQLRQNNQTLYHQTLQDKIIKVNLDKEIIK